MQSEKLSTKIPSFGGLHYDHWSELMEKLLCGKGLWDLVKTGVEEPVEGTNEQLEKLEKSKLANHKVKHYLFQVIDWPIFKQILDRSTSKYFGIHWNLNLEEMKT